MMIKMQPHTVDHHKEYIINELQEMKRRIEETVSKLDKAETWPEITEAMEYIGAYTGWTLQKHKNRLEKLRR